MLNPLTCLFPICYILVVRSSICIFLENISVVSLVMSGVVLICNKEKFERQSSEKETKKIPELLKPNCFAFFAGKMSEYKVVSFKDEMGRGLSSKEQHLP